MRFYRFESTKGTFFIVPRDGRWHPVFEDEWLGSYHSPEFALDDLVGGHTFWPSSGVDPSTCGLPSDLAEWDLVEFR